MNGNGLEFQCSEADTLPVGTKQPASDFCTQDDVTPQEIAAVDKALRLIDAKQQRTRLIATMAQWFLVLEMYKGVELAYSRSKDRQSVAPQHRAVLANVMAFGEALLVATDK